MGFGTPLSLVIGLILISGGLVLFFLGNFRPDLKRDSDNVYAILAIIAGILGVISFNKEIVPSLEQLLLAGMGIFLMWENINNRTPNPNAANRFPDKRREDEFVPPPRRSYRADRAPEYDEFGGAPSSRSAGLRGSDYDYGGGSRAGYDDRRLPRRDERDRTRRDRPNRSSRFDDNYGAPRRDDGFGEPPQIADRSSRPRRDEPGFDRPAPAMEDERPRRRRNPEDAPRRRPDRVEDVNSTTAEDIPAADYVDFTPIESTDSAASSNGWGPQD